MLRQGNLLYRQLSLLLLKIPLPQYHPLSHEDTQQVLKHLQKNSSCANKPVIIPVSTSPLPAVAIPALPVLLKYPLPLWTKQ